MLNGGVQVNSKVSESFLGYRRIQTRIDDPLVLGQIGEAVPDVEYKIGARLERNIFVLRSQSEIDLI